MTKYYQHYCFCLIQGFVAIGVIITNEKFMPFGEELGQSRWWRFAQVVQVRPHSIGASGPDVDPRANLTLINMHSPSSQRVGWFEDPRTGTTKVFKNTLKDSTKIEYVRMCLEHTGPVPTILAGDTNIKNELELVTLTTRDSKGQWGVQPNYLKADDFIIFRGFRGRLPTRRSPKTFQE